MKSIKITTSVRKRTNRCERKYGTSFRKHCVKAERAYSRSGRKIESKKEIKMNKKIKNKNTGVDV